MKKFFVGFLILYVILFFLLSWVTPLIADDYGYRWTALGASSVIIDAAKVAANYYFTWGGRSLAHFFAFLMMWSYSTHFGFLLYAVANTIVFVSILYCSYLIVIPSSCTLSLPSERDKSSSLWSLRELSLPAIVVLSLLIFLMTVNAKYHYQTMLWATGSAHYLWMYLLFAATLARAKKFLLEEGEQSWTPFDYVLFFCAGLSYENVGISLCALLVMRWTRPLASRFFRKSNSESPLKLSFVPRVNQILPFASVLAGSLIMLNAPGNSLRDKVANPEGTGNFLMKLQWWVESLLIFFGRPEGLVLLLTSGILLYFLRKYRQVSLLRLLFETKRVYNLGILFCIMTAAFIGHTGNFYGRKSFNIGWVFCLFVVSIIVQSGLANFVAKIKFRNLFVLLTFFLGLSSLRWAYDLTVVKGFADKLEVREQQILQEKVQGNLKVRTYAVENPFDLEDLSEDPNSWINAPYAKILGVEEITVVKAVAKDGSQ